MNRKAELLVRISAQHIVDETANATTALEPASRNRGTLVHINDLHVTFAHAHKGAL